MNLHFNLVLFLFAQIFWSAVLISVLPSTFMTSANLVITNAKLRQIENNKPGEFQDDILRNLTRSHLNTTVWKISLLLLLKTQLWQVYSFFSTFFPREYTKFCYSEYTYPMTKQENPLTLSKKYTSKEKSGNGSPGETGQLSHWFYCDENAFSAV